MPDPVSVRDVMTRSYVGVSEADAVDGVARLMREEGVHGAVVLRGHEPVGVVDVDRLLDLVADGRDPAETTAGELMRPAVTVDAEGRLEAAISAMTADGIRHLLVEEGGELVGSVSEHDVVAAHAVLETRSVAAVGANGDTTDSPGPDQNVPDPEAVRDQEIYSTQGVCESCGSLTRELSSVNGQLVCADCQAL